MNTVADSLELKTHSQIPLTTGLGRFIVFSVDSAATSRGAAHPSYKFYLFDGTTEIPTFTTPIDPCTDARGGAFTVGATMGKSWHYPATPRCCTTGRAWGSSSRNGTNTSNGDDGAIDKLYSGAGRDAAVGQVLQPRLHPGQRPPRSPSRSPTRPTSPPRTAGPSPIICPLGSPSPTPPV